MLPIRVIPCLDVAAGRVVKGVQFDNLVDAGNPVELATNYYRAGADEVTLLDVTATVEARSALLDTVSSCAEGIFIPLTVGGGVRSRQDVEVLLQAGADKVSVASAALARPTLVDEIASTFGDQVLVASLDIRANPSMRSGYEVTAKGGREGTDRDAVEWAGEVAARGAGELLVNSIDADGTKAGFDLQLIARLRDRVSVPLIASGGAGELDHFVSAARAGADAVLAASVFHRGEISIAEVKSALRVAGFAVREVSLV